MFATGTASNHSTLSAARFRKPIYEHEEALPTLNAKALQNYNWENITQARQGGGVTKEVNSPLIRHKLSPSDVPFSNESGLIKQEDELL